MTFGVSGARFPLFSLESKPGSRGLKPRKWRCPGSSRPPWRPLRADRCAPRRRPGAPHGLELARFAKAWRAHNVRTPRAPPTSLFCAVLRCACKAGSVCCTRLLKRKLAPSSIAYRRWQSPRYTYWGAQTTLFTREHDLRHAHHTFALFTVLAPLLPRLGPGRRSRRRGAALCSASAAPPGRRGGPARARGAGRRGPRCGLPRHGGERPGRRAGRAAALGGAAAWWPWWCGGWRGGFV